jgi:hypothetical protein
MLGDLHGLHGEIVPALGERALELFPESDFFERGDGNDSHDAHT